MKNQVLEALQNASKEELIDIIMERLYLDPVFRKTVENRLLSKGKSVSEQIDAFKNQIDEEMSQRYPDTTVLRSACFNLKRAMDTWSVYDFLLANVAIIRTIDNALCYGAGMEDDTDFELSMEVEDARDNAIKKIQGSKLDVKEKEKVCLLLNNELKTPLDVFGKDVFLEIIDAVQKAE